MVWYTPSPIQVLPGHPIQTSRTRPSPPLQLLHKLYNNSWSRERFIPAHGSTKAWEAQALPTGPPTARHPEPPNPQRVGNINPTPNLTSATKPQQTGYEDGHGGGGGGGLLPLRASAKKNANLNSTPQSMTPLERATFWVTASAVKGV